MNKKIIGAGALLATGLVAGGLFSVGTLANAATDSTSTVSSTTGTATPPTFGNGQSDEVAVTGDALTKLTDAATAKYPGATVIRAEEDADGAKYEVHLKLADGSVVTVEFDADFNITATHEGFGKGGPLGGAGKDPFSSTSVRDDEEAVSAEVEAKLNAAALAQVPGATVIRAETDGDGAAYEVHLKKADGTVVTIKFDSNFNVTATEDGFGKGGPMGGHGGPGGHGDNDGDGPAFSLPGSTGTSTNSTSGSDN